MSHTTVNTCVKEDLKCRSYRRQTSQILTEKTKNLRLIKPISTPFLFRPETRWTTSFGHTSRTSPTWPPTKPKPAWSPPSAEYSLSSCWHLWKRHAPSSGSILRRWLRLKVATLNRCHLYYIIKLPELIFSIKVLKLTCSVIFFRMTILLFHPELWFVTFLTTAKAFKAAKLFLTLPKYCKTFDLS